MKPPWTTERMSLLNGRKILKKAADNWPAKVLSVALAIVVYLFHQVGTLEERFFSVPLRVETSGDFIPDGTYNRMVKVTVRGEASSIYPITENDIEVYADLRSFHNEGEYKVPVLYRTRGNALGVTPLEINVDPMELSVFLDKRIVKRVELLPNLRGYLENGFGMVSFSLEPREVEIEGPKAILDGINSLSTDEIDLSGRNSSFSVEAHIVNRDPRLEIKGNGRVSFRAEIEEFIVWKNFEKLPIQLTGLDDRFTARPFDSAGALRLEGGEAFLEDFVPPDSALSVDCSAVKSAGTYTLPVRADIPPGLTLLRYEPREIEIVVVGERRGETQ